MKRMVLPRFGVDAFTIEEVSIPRPGPREVLVRVRANSINFRDLYSGPRNSDQAIS